jgi:hypothetical protein
MLVFSSLINKNQNILVWLFKSHIWQVYFVVRRNSRTFPFKNTDSITTLWEEHLLETTTLSILYWWLKIRKNLYNPILKISSFWNYSAVSRILPHLPVSSLAYTQTIRLPTHFQYFVLIRLHRRTFVE